MDQHIIKNSNLHFYLIFVFQINARTVLEIDIFAAAGMIRIYICFENCTATSSKIKRLDWHVGEYYRTSFYS